MIFRKNNVLFHPVERENDDGEKVLIGYRQDTCKSINEAKRRSRSFGGFKAVRCGLPDLPLVTA